MISRSPPGSRSGFTLVLPLTTVIAICLGCQAGGLFLQFFEYKYYGYHFFVFGQLVVALGTYGLVSGVLAQPRTRLLTRLGIFMGIQLIVGMLTGAHNLLLPAEAVWGWVLLGVLIAVLEGLVLWGLDKRLAAPIGNNTISQPDRS